MDEFERALEKLKRLEINHSPVRINRGSDGYTFSSADVMPTNTVSITPAAPPAKEPGNPLSRYGFSFYYTKKYN